jgi:hypothetical protein
MLPGGNMIATLLSSAIAFNNRALRANLDGVTHEASLLQPPGGNCINWQLGHIVRHRNYMLETLGAPTVWNAEAQARYDRGSQPITAAGADVAHLDALRRESDLAAERILAALAAADDAAFSAPARTSTVAQWLLFLAQHEAYHVGQIGLLRRVAGMEPAIR